MKTEENVLKIYDKIQGRRSIHSNNQDQVDMVRNRKDKSSHKNKNEKEDSKRREGAGNNDSSFEADRDETDLQNILMQDIILSNDCAESIQLEDGIITDILEGREDLLGARLLKVNGVTVHGLKDKKIHDIIKLFDYGVKITVPIVNGKILQKPKYQPESGRSHQGRSHLRLGSIILVVLAIAIGASGWVLRSLNTNAPEKVNITEQLENMAERFSQQSEEIWEQFNDGVMSVESKAEPSVFMVVQWNEGDGDDQAYFISKAVGDAAAGYLANSTIPPKPVVLSPEDILWNDHGELVDLCQRELPSRYVLIIRDIERIPGKMAQGLRYVCDEHNPLVDKVVVINILNMNHCPGVTRKHFQSASINAVTVMSEACLTHFWGEDLGPNILQPVLARIINIVVKILPARQT